MQSYLTRELLFVEQQKLLKKQKKHCKKKNAAAGGAGHCGKRETATPSGEASLPSVPRQPTPDVKVTSTKGFAKREKDRSSIEASPAQAVSRW